MSEEKTGQAVDRCRQVIATGVEKIFATKKAQTVLIVQDMLRGTALDSAAFSRLFSNQDLKEITSIAKDAISAELANRFKAAAITPVLKIELADLGDYFNLINRWLTEKQKTVMMSEQAVKWSCEAWNLAIDDILNNRLAAKAAAGNLGIGKELLKALEVDPVKEQRELSDGMFRRVQGLMDSIKMRIVQELSLRAAEIIYSVHDLIIGKRLQEKILTLEESLSNREISRTEQA